MWKSFISDTEGLEYIAKQVIPNIKIVEERGLTNGTHCTIDNKGQIIVHWDSLMYEYFDKYLTLIDSFPYDEEKDGKLEEEMISNYMGVLLDHLSEKNKKSEYINTALRKLANRFNYPCFEYVYSKLPEVSEMTVQYFIQTGVIKLLIMYHELAHCLFRINPLEREKWENVVISNLEMIRPDEEQDYLFRKDEESIKGGKELLRKLRSKDCESLVLLEELAADSFALSKAYATTHLNIRSLPKSVVSDHLMVGYLRYIDISAQYGYIVESWKDLYAMCILKKKRDNYNYKESLWNKVMFNSIRCEFWGILSLVGILHNDVDAWNYNPPNGISLADPRLKEAVSIYTNNANVIAKMTVAGVDSKIFNVIVDEAIDLMEKNNTEEFEYDTIPENPVLISWLFVQYQNYSGIRKLSEQDYIGALIDCRLAAGITERILGFDHRLTARGHNNICNCYLSIVKEYLNGGIANDSLKYQESLELAYYHSFMARHIIETNNEENDIQAGYIYQSAGKVSVYSGRYVEALSLFLTARKIKEDNLINYEKSNAITDVSIADMYYHLGNYSEAEKYCKYALDYYELYCSEDQLELVETRALYEMIQNEK